MTIYRLLCEGPCNSQELLNRFREAQGHACESKLLFGRHSTWHADLAHVLRVLVYTDHKQETPQSATCMVCGTERRYG